MFNVEYNKNKLNVSGKIIEFKSEISELKENDNYLFVRVSVTPSLELNDNILSNIYAINKLGEIQWQIKNNAPKGNAEYICAPLVGMDIKKDGSLFVTDFMGRKFEVNQKNGVLEQMKIVK